MIDGNLKLNGPICGRPCAELLHSQELKLFTACPYSRTPVRGKRRCPDHDLTRWVGDGVGEEVVVQHRRRRVLLTESWSDPYDVLLKPIDPVLSGDADGVPGRWLSASQATEQQLKDYWSEKEKNGFALLRTVVDGLACRTHKEACKDYAKLIKQGRLGGVLVAATTTGFILHIAPFAGAESIPVRYFFIAALKQHGP